MLERLKIWIEKMKKEVTVLWLATKDERTPMGALVMSTFIVAYVLSPIDLIPDFIPVIGYLDDVLMLYWGMSLVKKMIPDELLVEFRKKAQEISELPKSYAGAIIILCTWIVATAIIVSWWMGK